MKHILPMILVSSLLSSALTAGVFWLMVPRTVDAQAQAQTVVAKRVSIVDDQGQERISLGQSPDNPDSYELRVYGASGRELLQLGGLDGVSSLSMSGSDVPWKVLLLGADDPAATGLTVYGAGGGDANPTFTSVTPVWVRGHFPGRDWRVP